ncbi:hypothetical protein NDU88_007657 [Pleurodeles waltl]|uniref:Uncharacterized protein n=1 Tax=Pleurodeles waltl TaxID=8319 RepID=A0AAV7QNN9_PLEWA|nr:hypothetical protein NDU88_007657 [Pleurodeles waltl]
MGTRSKRGTHREVTGATSDDEESSDWPRGEEGGQKGRNSRERGEEGTRGGGGGEEKQRDRENYQREEKPQETQDEDSGPRRSRSGLEDGKPGPIGNHTGDRREELPRASHDPGGSWLWKLTAGSYEDDHTQYQSRRRRGTYH